MIDDHKICVPDLRAPLTFDLSPGVAANGEPMLDNWDAAEYAAEEFLDRSQVIAIMQGLEPRYRRGRPPCLDEYWADVQRLLDDVRKKRMPMPCRPRELVNWARTQDFKLPAAFVKHVPEPIPAPAPLLLKAQANQEGEGAKFTAADPPGQVWTPPPGKLSPAQESRMECQRLARQIWVQKPQLTKEQMLRERSIAPYTRSYAMDTVRKWLSEADPRPPESKPGPRRKRPLTGLS